MEINEFIEQLNKINIFPTEEQLQLLEKYYNIVVEENKYMNLTGITEKKEFYLKHFYDSLTLNKIVDLKKIKSLCDIGSGAGFPGIVIKILFPHIEITLIDSLNKRINFLNATINKLELTNIVAISARAEDYSKVNKEKYDLVTARAVAPVSILLECSVQLVKVNSYFVAMKGNFAENINISDVCKKLNLSLEKIIKFQLPKENSERTLLSFVKKAPTNTKYPRSYKEIKSKPL